MLGDGRETPSREYEDMISMIMWIIPLLTLYAVGHLSTLKYMVLRRVLFVYGRIDFAKEVETPTAYPDICFAIDDFNSTFDAVLCLCVGKNEFFICIKNFIVDSF
ncbi:hypothetical protein Peur_047630 [Populus x canadensis]